MKRTGEEGRDLCQLRELSSAPGPRFLGGEEKRMGFLGMRKEKEKGKFLRGRERELDNIRQGDCWGGKEEGEARNPKARGWIK